MDAGDGGLLQQQGCSLIIQTEAFLCRHRAVDRGSSTGMVLSGEPSSLSRFLAAGQIKSFFVADEAVLIAFLLGVSDLCDF